MTLKEEKLARAIFIKNIFLDSQQSTIAIAECAIKSAEIFYKVLAKTKSRKNIIEDMIKAEEASQEDLL